MLKKILSKISNKKQGDPPIKGANFFNLSPSEKERIIKRAAKLSAKDQQDLLDEYDRKFGKLQTHIGK